MKIWREDGFYAYQIEVLTPVHIGGGEQFTPLDYVIREAAGGDYEAVLIDTSGWLAANSERPEAAKALEEGDMAGLRRALNASPDLSAFARGRIRISSASLGKSLLQKSRTIENKAELLPFIRNPFTMRPYIPASSLKGAISSALTDCLNEIGTGPKLRECRDNREYRKTMEAMFGKIGDHAMSWAKMGDIALPPDCSSIRSVVGVDIKPPASAERTPVETLDPVFFNKFKVCGNLRLASNGKGAPAIELPGGVRINFAKLSAICDSFYKSRFEQEYQKFYTRPDFAETGKALAPLRERVGKLDPEKEILLRVGRFSHIECVTVSGPEKGGTSRALADKLLPFGWIVLKRCSFDEYQKSIEAIDAMLLEESEKMAEREAKERKVREEREAREREAAEAARKREEELAKLSPEERELWELVQPDATENMASAIYAKLERYGDLKIKAAEALKAYWIRINKWEGKELTKKQKEKVKVARMILEGRE